jgi:hypothetical protein
LERAIHPGNTDRSKQSADGCWYETYQQGHKRWNVGAEALKRLGNSYVARHVLFRVPRHRP